MDYAHLLARIALSAVFLVAGMAKLMDRAGSRAALPGFGLPASLASPLGIALPVAELLVAAALIPSASARWGAIGALLLLGLFMGGIANVMIHGRDAQCHCFGQLHSSKVGWPTLARTVALALAAGLIVMPQGVVPGRSVLQWFAGATNSDVVAVVMGALALVVVATVSWFMGQLLRQHGRILLRLDALEEELAGRGIIAHGSGAATADGLPLGTPAPSFSLSDLHGGRTSLQDLLAPALPLMLVFGHPGCTPCAAMLPEVGDWQAAHANRLTIALVSEGSVDQNRAAATEHGIVRVLLQAGREIAQAYEAWGTPSAVMVSIDGSIASRVAQGAAEMRELLDSATRSIASGVASAARDGRIDVDEHAPRWRADTLAATPE